jgi:hypothetical protein
MNYGYLARAMTEKQDIRNRARQGKCGFHLEQGVPAALGRHSEIFCQPSPSLNAWRPKDSTDCHKSL